MALLRTRQPRRAGIAGLVLVALTVSGCANAEPGVVAYVDDARITQRQVDDAVNAISGTLEEGQRVSSQAVVNAMIHGELAEQVAARQNIVISDSDRDEVLKGSNLAPLLTVEAARPVLDDIADEQIVGSRLGQQYFTEIGKINVTLNPRLGVLDPQREDDHRESVQLARIPGTRRPNALSRWTIPQLARLIDVMATLRQACPWDAQQTHESLAQYLIEETAETIEAVETGDQDHLREELGDLLLQVVFHAEIAAERDGGFTIEDIAAGTADKLIARHPYVFATEETPDDLHFSWEQRKAAEKGRTSVLEGIPDQLSSLARANKIVSRVRSRRVPVDLPSDPIDEDDLGRQVLALVARAQASGIDPDQAVRAAVRDLEARVRVGEASRNRQAAG